MNHVLTHPSMDSEIAIWQSPRISMWKRHNRMCTPTRQESDPLEVGMKQGSMQGNEDPGKLQRLGAGIFQRLGPVLQTRACMHRVGIG